MISIFIIIALIGVLVGSYTDIKTLEVPDWLNYSLIAVGLGGNLIFSIAFWDHTYILRSLLGFGASLLIGFLMFYTGQWGGGDSKMIFGLGALLGLSYPLQIEFYVKFLVNMLFFGAVYGIIWIIVMSLKNKKKLLKKKKILFRKHSKSRLITGIISIIGLIIVYLLPLDNEFKFVFAGMILKLYFTNYLLVFVKAVEQVSMIRLINPEKLTEGDWIVKDIKVDGKRIAGPKDLGINKKQIKRLLELKQQGKIDKVKVKYGIPFVPSFLFAMIYTIIFNKIILLMFV